MFRYCRHGKPIFTVYRAGSISTRCFRQLVSGSWTKARKSALIMKWVFLKWLPVLSFGILIFCQMTWKHFDSPGMYYKGLALCLLGLAYANFFWQGRGTVKNIYSFIVGLCLWNLVEEIFFDPEKYDPSEYWGFLAGGLFLFYQLWKSRRKKN